MRKEDVTSTSDIRNISKPVALGIWEEGYPKHRWAFYDKPVCGKCRKYFESKYLTKEMRCKADTIFAWIYDDNDVFHSPISSDSEDDDCQPAIDELDQSIFTDNFNIRKKFLQDTGFDGRITKTFSYANLQPRSQCNFRCQSRKILSHVLNILSAKEADIIWKDYMNDEYEDYIDENNFDTTMTAINTALTNADHYSIKRQILGIVAADFPSGVLRAHLPSVNSYQIKAARKHAYSKGRGAPVNTKREPVQRYNEQQVGHFLEFVVSPCVTTDIPFGKKTLKLTTGKTLEVVNTIRNTISTRIIQQYHSYCHETTNGEFKPLSDSSLYAILEGCSASTRKSMSGIDNYAANGSTAFDNLKKICDEFAIFHVPVDTIVQLQKALQQCRNYIKIDYKTHVSTSSTIADHCSTFGLSDESVHDWNETCDHAHTDRCEDCLLIDNTFSQIEWILKENKEILEDIRIRYLSLFNRHVNSIQEWKKHQLRAVHQDAARDAALDSLNENSVRKSILD
ncbi:unnamed protein product [Rotaria sp. Silwood2]|nr:unnamed protein product [Rotaria sp. Silwood2]